MKHALRLFLLFCAAAVLTPVVRAQGTFVKKRASLAAMRQTPSLVLPKAGTEGGTVSFPYALAAFYAATGDVGNYYLVLSAEEGEYDSANGTINTTGWALCLDLYAPASSPIELPVGEYAESDDCSAFTCNPDYSYLIVYGENGETEAVSQLSGPVVVEKDTKGQFLITANVTHEGGSYRLVYNGDLDFTNTNQATDVFQQIDHDVTGEFTGAMAIYNGNLFESNTGNMQLCLFDTTFDPETGGFTDTGHMVQLFLFSTLFNNPSKASVVAGTYTMARNFKRGTWYPGLEIDYLGMTIPFGTYVCNLYGTTTDDMSYGYITSGEVVIEQDDEGVYTVTVDGLTDKGRKVQITYRGGIPVTNKSADTPSSHISTLEGDYELSLDHIELAHIYRDGTKYGCGSYVVDLGSPSGGDQFVTDHQGDILRMEFLTEPGEAYLPPMIYEVMEEKWYTYYAPGRMTKGYWVTGGDLSGTRWVHFAEGRYYIMDGIAPIEDGSVVVEKNEDTGEYTFTINLVDDAGYYITGKWTGPVELMYDPEAIITGIEGVDADGKELQARFLDRGTLQLDGVSASDEVRIYDVSGQLVTTARGAGSVSVGHLPAGVYVVSVEGKSPVKIMKR